MNMRLLLHVWLGFLLVFAQQGAVGHALSHLSEPAPSQSSQDKQLPHSPACDKCVVYAQMAGSVAATPLIIFGQNTAVVLTAPWTASHFSLFFSAYFSRAPPRLV
jgi:hypothetical protein